MNFEVFKRTRRRKVINAELKPAHITVQRTPVNTLYLNRRIMDLFDSPYAVRLLYDSGNRIIGLQPCDVNDNDAFKLGGPPDRSHAYICAAPFLKHYELEHTETARYACEMHDGILCMYLNQPVV